MNEARRVVSDAGPLISLENLRGGYLFIRHLYDRIIVPPVVLEEVARGRHASVNSYLSDYKVGDLVGVQTTTSVANLPERDRLYAGEAEVISLALELKLPLLIEETAGRRVAQAVGLSISGIAGQIIRAFRLGSLKGKLAELEENGRISKKLCERLTQTIAGSDNSVSVDDKGINIPTAQCRPDFVVRAVNAIGRVYLSVGVPRAERCHTGKVYIEP